MADIGARRHGEGWVFSKPFELNAGRAGFGLAATRDMGGGDYEFVAAADFSSHSAGEAEWAVYRCGFNMSLEENERRYMQTGRDLLLDVVVDRTDYCSLEEFMDAFDEPMLPLAQTVGLDMYYLYGIYDAERFPCAGQALARMAGIVGDRRVAGLREEQLGWSTPLPGSMPRLPYIRGQNIRLPEPAPSWSHGAPRAGGAAGA